MFEGPLDLLLYLIRKQNLDILSIPIVKITEQYINYINNMQILNIDLAAEYLLMAAMLLAIKSRLMLPKIIIAENEEDEAADPRNELIQRLIEYEKIKHQAMKLDAIPTADRDFTWVKTLKNTNQLHLPEVVINEIANVWQQIITQSLINHKEHYLKRQELSVREHMNLILKKLNYNVISKFHDLLDKTHGTSYIVVNFVAILELCKEGLIYIFLEAQEVMVKLK